jgi:hypoxanthine phosphoribosyltransferase
MTELFNAEDIRFRTQLLAKQISDNHRGDGSPIIMIGLLNGAFMFYSELVKNISIDVECDFMRVKSYIAKNKQGDIQITKDLETPIKGKHVYIVDDILDSGNTMAKVIEYLEIKWPKTINVVTLLKRKNTPFRRKNYDMIEGTEMFGFEINNEWVAGMGMDNDKGYMRNYPSVWSI